MATAKKMRTVKWDAATQNQSPLIDDNQQNASHPHAEITLYDLMAYRDQMTAAQLERYGDYYLFKVPPKPFTREEVMRLKVKKEFHTMRRKVRYLLSDCQAVASELEKSRKEAWNLISMSRQQHIRTFDSDGLHKELSQHRHGLVQLP